MTVPFLDLRAGIEEVRAELDQAWARVRDGGRYILGGEVAAFESEFAAFCGTRYCVGVASGLDALKLVLEASGVGAGDEVIVPAYTAVATWMAVSAIGARPVGVDVQASTLNIDPQLVEDALTPRTRAIIAVHLFGHPARTEELQQIADKHGLFLFEDAAHAHGAKRGGRRAGSLARAAAFSFYPTKNLGALGDGGAITTNDDRLAERVRMLRSYGWRERGESEMIGHNSRLDELQAAFLRIRLSRLDADNDRRRHIAHLYTENLASLAEVSLPELAPGTLPVWHVYAVVAPNRHESAQRLSAAGVETLVHYDPLPHLTSAYKASGWGEGDFPVAERIAASELSLPMYPQLSDEAALTVTSLLLG